MDSSERMVSTKRRPRYRRRSITFPAEVNKRGSAYYITVNKSFREMLDIQDGDIVDVTLTRPREDEEYED